MAPTFRHGKSAYLSLTDTAGSAFVISSGGDDLSFNSAVDTAEVTSFGDGDRAYLAGLRNHDMSFSGHFSSTHYDKLAPMLGHSTDTTFIYGPAGDTTGYIKLTGKAIVTGVDVGSPVGDKVSMSVNMQVTGVVTTTNF